MCRYNIFTTFVLFSHNWSILQRFGGEGTKALSGKDESRYLRDEVINLESQVDKKETEIHDLEAQLRQKQQASDEVSAC